MLRNLKTGSKIIGLVLVAALFMGVVVGNIWKEGGEGEAELRQVTVQGLPLFDAIMENGEQVTLLAVAFEQAVLLVAAPETDVAARLELAALRDRVTGMATEKGGLGNAGAALELLDTAIGQAHNEGERRRYRQIRESFARVEVLEKQLVMALVGALDERLKGGRMDGFQGKVAEWRQRFGELSDLEHGLRMEVNQTVTASVAVLTGNLAQGALVGLWLGLGALVLTLALGWWIARDITRPLAAAVAMAETIAAGDLRGVTVAAERRGDEAGLLLDALRRMRTGLCEQVRELKEAVSALATSASEISASTTEFASTAAETAASINETTATAEEVKQTARVSHEKSQQMAERAQSTARTAQAGKKAADETGSLIGRLKDEMETVAATIVTLSEQSQAIGQIIATVDALAEQSNVLAVNAAIEAARAGEQGRGFAVVAQEVKSLAEQSKQGTSQVRTILNDIQKSTGRAVMATEHGSKTVVQGVKQAQDSGEAILSLVRNVEDGAAAATQIALSSQQQMVGVDQVTLAMETIRQAGQQNAASATQLENAAATLSALGHKLQQLTEHYQV